MLFLYIKTHENCFFYYMRVIYIYTQWMNRMIYFTLVQLTITLCDIGF